jgi:two-component system phosphate regulon response regulator PhoB
MGGCGKDRPTSGKARVSPLVHWADAGFTLPTKVIEQWTGSMSEMSFRRPIMDSLVLIASHDADFCLFTRHILSEGGFAAKVVDPDGGAEANVIASAKAIIVESCDDIERVLAFCRGVRSVRTPRPIAIMALIRSRHEHHYFSLMKAGVDECVLRPLAPDLIISCLTGVIARNGEPRGIASPIGQIAELTTKDETREIIGKDRTVHLSPTEYRLLKRLLENPGHVVSRTQLIEAAWPVRRFVEPRTVDVHIGKLRRSLEAATGRRIIRTIRSSGFVAEVRQDFDHLV